jgi:hypothetical protein
MNIALSLVIASIPVLLQVFYSVNYIVYHNNKFLNLYLISSYDFEIPNNISLYINKFFNLMSTFS